MTTGGRNWEFRARFPAPVDPGRIGAILDEIKVDRFAGFFEIEEGPAAWRFLPTPVAERFEIRTAGADGLVWRRIQGSRLTGWAVGFIVERLVRTLDLAAGIDMFGRTKTATFDLRNPTPAKAFDAYCETFHLDAAVRRTLREAARPLFERPSAHARAAARRRLSARAPLAKSVA